MVERESTIQRRLLKHAKAHPKVAWMDRANSGKVKVKGGFMQLHEKGTPDLIGYATDGKFIGIEIKDVKNYNSFFNGLSEDQLLRLADLEANGCYAGVACTTEHVDKILGE